MIINEKKEKPANEAMEWHFIQYCATPLFFCLFILLLPYQMLGQNDGMINNNSFEEIKDKIEEPSSHCSYHFALFEKEGYLNSILPTWYAIAADAPYIIDKAVNKAPHQLNYKLDVLPQDGQIMLGFNIHKMSRGGTLIYTKLNKPAQKGKTYAVSCWKENSIYSTYASHNVYFKFTNDPKQIINNESNEVFNLLRTENTDEVTLRDWAHLKTTHEVDSDYTYLVIGSRYSPNDYVPSNTKVQARHTVSTALYYLDNIQVLLDTTPQKIAADTKTAVEESTKIFNLKMVLEAVSFRYDSYELDDKGKEILRELYDDIKDFNVIQLSVDGFSDAQGTSEYNMELSQKRALTAYNYLIDLGMDKERMRFQGHGEEDLIDKINPNSHENRRVEITITYENE